MKTESLCDDVNSSQALKYKALEEAFNRLQKDYEGAVEELDEKDKKIDELLAVVSDTEDKFRFAESRLSASIEQNKFQKITKLYVK